MATPHEALLHQFATAILDLLERPLYERADLWATDSPFLVRMLDELGMSRFLGIASSHALFADRVDLLHATSAVRYPVVIRGDKNYSGSSPRLIRHPKLRSLMREYLVYELSRCPNALVIPLGKYVGEAVLDLASEGLVDAKRCLFGFPHPSGGNGHRAKQFEERREELAHTMQTWFAKK